MIDVLHICAPNSAFKGLGWNAWHTTEMLRSRGYTAEWCQSPAAEIVYHVLKHAPKVAVIMAVWVPAEELSRLAAACPGTVFVVKNHSGPQFLAQEGKSWKWLLDCGDLNTRMGNVRVGVIREDDVDAMKAMGMPCVLLPNVYSPSELAAAKPRVPAPASSAAMFNVGLFGAFRPLKNAVGMTMAVCGAAAQIRESGGRVTLHVNQRAEMGGNADPDIIAEMCRRSGVALARHAWLDHMEFKSLAAQMDVCMAATYHDTYNYVAADCVTAGCPVVGSPAVNWLPIGQQVNPDCTDDMTRALLRAPGFDTAVQLDALREFDQWACLQLIETFQSLGAC